VAIGFGFIHEQLLRVSTTAVNNFNGHFHTPGLVMIPGAVR